MDGVETLRGFIQLRKTCRVKIKQIAGYYIKLLLKIATNEFQFMLIDEQVIQDALN
jgi:hypothetical protein